ncbi:DNA polymerase III subunit theta [Klebsiella pneumoniae]|uniref:DNA polymerase III subunit theta n=1 Tax=Klebsiella pneumoniae TaxID=573 RepID=UPI0021A47378|nr:DNA polymerase III subunit theta [Klebsiella pneumoniae]MCT4359058.1 DNA polymerase III subunit theta [Klebsiella pneumoniae]
MSQWNIAAKPKDEQDKVNVDLAASGVAYKERLNMPVIAEVVIREQPEHPHDYFLQRLKFYREKSGNDSNLLIVFYVQIMPDDFVMQLHRF